MKIKNDFTQCLSKNLEIMAESHLVYWESRYSGYSIQKLKEDLLVNHDPSIEIEGIELELGRKISDVEYEYLINKLNEEIVKQFKDYL